MPSWARYSRERIVFLSRHLACPGIADTRERDRGRVSALCQAALRKQTDGHAMDQGLSLDQDCFWTLSCVYFPYLFFIFFGTLILDMYMFPFLTGVLFLFISELFVRPQTNPILPYFSVRFLACSLAFELCVIYIFRIRTLIGHNNCQFVLHFILHFSFY